MIVVLLVGAVLAVRWSPLQLVGAICGLRGDRISDVAEQRLWTVAISAAVAILLSPLVLLVG